MCVLEGHNRHRIKSPLQAATPASSSVGGGAAEACRAFLLQGSGTPPRPQA